MGPWADHPFVLIPIKSLKPSASPDALWIASEMANAHNGLIRALNSMYLQAPYITEDSDVRDLLQFAIFWEAWIEEHHLGEEKFFFPEVERITGEKDIMEKNIEQHHAFLPGMHAFLSYVRECKDEKSSQRFDHAKFVQLIDAFGPLLAKHLAEEIETLLGLDKYDIQAIKAAYVEFDLKLRAGDKAVLFPTVLGNCDHTYEGGNLWPGVPGFITFLVHYYFERKYQSVWRFNSCTTWGEPRPLLFLSNE